MTVALGLASTRVVAQDAAIDVSHQPPVHVPAGFRSPKSTVLTFLGAINHASGGESQAWTSVYDCFDLSDLDQLKARDTALKLWGVLNRLEYIDGSTPLPDDREVDRDGLVRYTYFPNERFDRSLNHLAKDGTSITLVKVASGAWKFSSQTVQNIHNLYVELADLEIVADVHDERHDSVALLLRSKMPTYLRRSRLLNLEYWQWIGLAILILLGVTLDQAVRFALRLFTNHLLARRDASARSETIALTVRPLGLLMAGLLWLVILPVLNLPGPALLVLLTAVRLFSVLAGTWASWCATNLICEILERKAAHTATKFDDVLIPLLRKTVKILIVAFGLVYGASALSIPIMPMLTSLGIGGLAFAFAAKDTIENFFGSVAVLLDRPFEVGDWVVIGDVEGTVEEVGFRSTRIRTFYNSQITVANATLVRATVDNYGRRRYRRVKTHVGIQYDTPPDKIIAFTEGIRELVRSHPYTRKDYFQVWFNQFGPSSLDILLYVFHETDDWTTELRERERLFLDIVRLADQLGVQFAFPTQTVHLYQGDSHATHQPLVPPSTNGDQQAAGLGIQSAQRIIRDQPWLGSKPEPVQFRGGPTVLNSDKDDQIENRSVGG